MARLTAEKVSLAKARAYRKILQYRADARLAARQEAKLAVEADMLVVKTELALEWAISQGESYCSTLMWDLSHEWIEARTKQMQCVVPDWQPDDAWYALLAPALDQRSAAHQVLIREMQSVMLQDLFDYILQHDGLGSELFGFVPGIGVIMFSVDTLLAEAPKSYSVALNAAIAAQSAARPNR